MAPERFPMLGSQCGQLAGKGMGDMRTMDQKFGQGGQ